MKTILCLLFISNLCFANENIVEFKNDKTPVTFKYDKREYAPEIVGSEDEYTLLSWNLSAKQLGKKESICTDKRFNKHHCPDLWIIIKNQGKSNYRQQEDNPINKLEWHIIDTNPKMYNKMRREFSPVVHDKGNWSQTVQVVACHKTLDKKTVFGDFSIQKTFYNKEFDITYRVRIADMIYVTPPNSDTNEFKRENFCENNEALKSWSAGSHAHMFLDSVKINPEFFKKK